ncbi:MAG: 4-hydroxythreonine-4-phosphate dehydrogenase PdxA, partial [Firmicutes bacterium]|nr:4-hydroxythreonine-4-phosphate dehydrogenase PdxA [Bacillota bacterium]
MKPVLGVLLGEAAGIGPEIVAKLCAEDRLLPYCWPVLMGDLRVFVKAQEITGTSFPVTVIEDVSHANWEGPLPFLDLRDLDAATVKPGELNAYSGRVTGNALVKALQLSQAGAWA